LIPLKGHVDLVKPEDASDLSYLVLKQAASRLLANGNDDLSQARRAIEAGNGYALAALVANNGRSWIETVHGDAAVELLQRVVESFQPRSPEVIWSCYLLAVNRLFRYREASSTAFSDDLVDAATAIGLGPLFLAERMEFARKRGDRPGAIVAASTLLRAIDGIAAATDSGSAYALGTAYFLLGNLYRYGGQYPEARRVIVQARTFYRPAILAHQIELAHCDYALAICRAMEGAVGVEQGLTLPIGRDSRRFADGLITLTQSHSAWALANLGEAGDYAQRAADAFDQIGYLEYARRARSLGDLLGAWRRLQLGAPPETAIAHTPEHATIIRGMMGDVTARGALREWISRTRPSHVLGMLQFASAYSKDWTAEIGAFSLPPVLRRGVDGLNWLSEDALSLEDANSKLRKSMGIAQEVRLPLIAD
jgi:hypothetical protein